MRGFGLCAALAVSLALGGPAAAQQAAPATAPAVPAPTPGPAAPAAQPGDPARPATLADLRSDLRILAAELKALRAQLNASGAKGFAAAGGDSAIDRMNAMERELSRLTGETERLSNRIERVVRDGTNRVGDIEFRLCEMEDGCDLGALTTPTLGDMDGGSLHGTGVHVGPAGAETAVQPADVPLTAQERSAFEAGNAALQAGDFPRAAELFGAFARAHAGSPAAAEAQFLRGAALDSAGDAAGATAAWLSSFAAAPGGPRAADALLGLSRVAAVGKPASAGCAYLTELTTRFSGTEQADEAERRSVAAGCATLDAPVLEDSGRDPAPSDDPEAASDLADGG